MIRASADRLRSQRKSPALVMAEQHASVLLSSSCIHKSSELRKRAEGYAKERCRAGATPTPTAPGRRSGPSPRRTCATRAPAASAGSALVSLVMAHVPRDTRAPEERLAQTVVRRQRRGEPHAAPRPVGREPAELRDRHANADAGVARSLMLATATPRARRAQLVVSRHVGACPRCDPSGAAVRSLRRGGASCAES